MSVKVNVAPDEPSKLRDLLGILGMVGGVAAAPFTGGISLGAIGAGGALGTLAGGVSDSVINKGKDLQGGGIPLSGESAIKRRSASQSDGNYQHLLDALNVVHTLPSAMQDDVRKPLGDAFKQENEKNNYERFFKDFKGPKALA